MGFDKIMIRPQPVGDLKWVRAEHQSLYGTIACDWRQEGNGLTVRVTVPVNTTADVIRFKTIKVGLCLNAEMSWLDRLVPSAARSRSCIPLSLS